jgi:hypothetical protein
MRSKRIIELTQNPNPESYIVSPVGFIKGSTSGAQRLFAIGCSCIRCRPSNLASSGIDVVEGGSAGCSTELAVDQ